MTVRCPNLKCTSKAPLISCFGFFVRKEDGQKIQRYRCKNCYRSFSSATLKPCYRQRKRRINDLLRALLCGKVSQRRAAKIMSINVKTVAARVPYFGKLGRRHLFHLNETLRGLMAVEFDEMQTHEHTKCKPVAISMATSPEKRYILAVSVASMPAQPPLLEIALNKYGPRSDDREKAIVDVLEAIKPMLKSGATLTTDKALHYPGPIARVLPDVKHVAHLSRKARSNGQGELKRIVRDPLFNFNHTAAMVRDGLGCLVRKTWGNTKNIDRLADRLAMYAHYHNTVLKAP